LKSATDGVAVVPELLTDYTSESAIMTPNGVITGLASLKAFFEGFISGAPAGFVAAIQPTRQDIHGEVAYVLWSANPFAPLGTDTFVVRDGKIAYQTFAAYMPS